MARNGMAGRAHGLGLTGEKRPGAVGVVGGPPAHTAQPGDLCAPLRHPPGHSTLNPQFPTRLRAALVDGDECAHDFVRKAFEAHAKGWTLDSHLTSNSALDAFGSMPATPRSLRSKAPTSPQILQPHAPQGKLSILPAIDYRLDAPRSHVPPDVVLMGTQLPGLSGIECARRLAVRLPKARIVMFTACSEHNTIVESVMAGTWGYLIKPVAPWYLVWAVSEAAQGHRVLCGEAQAAAMDYLRLLGATRQCKTLSWREREVMLRVMNGTPNKAVASELDICAGTLHRHLDTIYKKLRVHGKDEARRKFAGGGVNS
jgi:DNA-binding NarL/FixJ family response regulator